MAEIRNILLVGSSGAGKSALANLLINKNNNFEEIFKESAGSVSQTKEHGVEEFQEGDITYRVIDTIGIGDTKLPENEVAYRIAMIAKELKEGIDQILFVTGGRFTEKEVGVFGILSGTLFGERMLDFTTIVRTNFQDFENDEDCNKDYQSLTDGSEVGSRLIRRLGRVVHIDNPPLKGRLKQIEANKMIKEIARERLLADLKNKRVTYRPETLPLQKLNDRLVIDGENESSKEEVKSVVWEMLRSSLDFMKESTEFGAKIGKEHIPIFGSTVGAAIGFGGSFVGTSLGFGFRLTEELLKGGFSVAENLVKGGADAGIKVTETVVGGGVNVVQALTGSGNKQQLNNLVTENAQLKVEISDIKAKLTSEEKNSKKLELEKVALNEKLQDLQVKFQAKEAEITKLTAENRTLKIENDKLNKIIDEDRAAQTAQIQVIKPTI